MSYECPECDTPVYDSACDAPDCPGLGCQMCGWGCDLDFAGSDSRCAAALAAETPEDQGARIAEERAAYGLPALARTPQGEESDRG